MWTDNQTPIQVAVKSPQFLLNVQDFPLPLPATHFTMKNQDPAAQIQAINNSVKANPEGFKYGQFLPRWVNAFLVEQTLVKAYVHNKRGLYQIVAQPYFHTA